MPTDSTPTDSTPTDYTVHSRVADAGRTESGEPGADPHGRVEPEAGHERDAGDPDVDRVATLERRMADLEAELDAVRGLLDGVEAVDETAERRASAALAKAESLEERFAPEDGLVRERLPDGSVDGAYESAEPDRTGRCRDGHRDGKPDPGERPEPTGSPIRGGNGRGSGEHAGSVDSPVRDGRASAGTSESGRAHPDNTGTADEGAAGTGAISSVGAGAPAEGATTGTTEDAERSLAARLRDAFR